jgi:hypothetical protein
LADIRVALCPQCDAQRHAHCGVPSFAGCASTHPGSQANEYTAGRFSHPYPAFSDLDDPSGLADPYTAPWQPPPHTHRFAHAYANRDAHSHPHGNSHAHAHEYCHFYSDLNAIEHLDRHSDAHTDPD